MRKLKRRRLRRILMITVPIVVVIGLIVTAIAWYEWALRPLDSSDTTKTRLTIASGASSPEIGHQLASDHLIRSGTAFDIYTRLHSSNKLQAGTYAFSPSQSLGDIVEDLASGKTDRFSITILPGQTMQDIRTMLKTHGYTDAEITAAYAGTYTNSILAIRPAGASLEGFFYPDTYNVLSDESLQTIFSRVFDNYSKVLSENNIQADFAAHGLSLYQGIILSSIVQKEVSGASTEAKVASVFYNRLDADISLGSVVTYQYGASLLGVTPSVTLNSPYNTYIVKGLPPTPISNPDVTALTATANPATTNYLFFLSGDDGVTYFAQTEAQHEANIAAHCTLKCG